MLDVRKLRGKVAECGLTQGEFAKKIGICTNTLARKAKGERPFTTEEADRIIAALDLTDAEVLAIFFAK
nr:MAG TPA: helix-turn-helix domain protein [Caudoviricetes sp.]